MAENKAVYWGTGRRKTSVARVRITPGTGLYTINGREFDAYFGRAELKGFVDQPFKVTETARSLRCHRQHQAAAASPVSLAHCATVSPVRFSYAGDDYRGELKSAWLPAPRPTYGRAQEVRPRRRPARRPQFSKR